MPWWWVVYLLAFSVLSIGGIVDDLQNRKPRWFLFAVGITYLLSLLLVVAVNYESLAHRVGRFVLPMLIFVIAIDSYSVSRDIHELEADESTSSREVFGGIAGVALLCLPAYIAGLILVVRAFDIGWSG